MMAMFFKASAGILALACIGWGGAILAEEPLRVALAKVEMSANLDLSVPSERERALAAEPHSGSCRRDLRRAEVALRSDILNHTPVGAAPLEHDAAALAYTASLERLLACVPSDANGWFLSAVDALRTGQTIEIVSRRLALALEMGPDEDWTTRRILEFATPRLAVLSGRTRESVVAAFVRRIVRGEYDSTLPAFCLAAPEGRAVLVSTLDAERRSSVEVRSTEVCPVRARTVDP